MACARLLISLILVLVLLGGPERVTTGSGDFSAPLQASAAPAPRGTAPGTTTCPVSKTIRDEPPKDPNADRFGFGDWYVNANRTIWVRNVSWQAGRNARNKVIWIRPAGTKLVVTGRRLDGQARPPVASSDRGYPTGFVVTGLYFPAAGCWDITAKAGNEELRFVTEVAPPGAAPSPAPAKPRESPKPDTTPLGLDWTTENIGA